ncbi:Integrase zinc binding domain [Popillia japonica]|uniref:RNA-directed DNA polymerase n=1 Tax=Popillia japonica TaxID=7064 RepID=A0AAW1LWU4_POPJA
MHTQGDLSSTPNHRDLQIGPTGLSESIPKTRQREAKKTKRTEDNEKRKTKTRKSANVPIDNFNVSQNHRDLQIGPTGLSESIPKTRQREAKKTKRTEDNEKRKHEKAQMYRLIILIDITKNHVEIIPIYEGDPNTLSMYISACEYLITTFGGNAHNAADPINEFLLRLFQSKLTGRALQLVGSRESITAWLTLKELLQTNFSDQRTETCLTQDLMQMRPEKNETIEASMNEAIDIKNPQYHIKQTYLNELTVEFNQNQGKKIYNVTVPKTNNDEKIFEFIRDYMHTGKHFLYFEQEKLYHDFCKVYVTHFNNNGPKLYRCLNKLQVVTNVDDQIDIIRNYHEGKTNHRGINETLKQLQRKYYWLNMKETDSAFIKRCEMCCRSKYERQTPRPALNVTENIDKPFQKIHMDTFMIGGKIYLTCIDAFTKFAQAIIKIHITTPYNPNSNGCVERLHSTLIEHMRILKEQHKDEIIEKLMKLAIIGKRNESAKAKPLQPKQQVYVKRMIGFKNKTTPKYTGPYEVKQVNQDNTAVVTDKNQKEKKVHIRNLKYGIVPDSLPESEDQPGTSR